MGVGIPPVRIAACGCLTPFGDAGATLRALLEGRRALQSTAVLGRRGGEPVPLALLPGRGLDESEPAGWLGRLRAMLGSAADRPWGDPRHPVCVASSNFGVGSLYAFRQGGTPVQAAHGTPHGSVELLRSAFGWGHNLAVFSHACVSAHLALLHASRLVAAGVAETALVFSYDFLSPFVAGGFYALKILNANFPAPYQVRSVGSIGLGDGAGFAQVTRGSGELEILEQSLENEMHHSTANRADGAGFSSVFAPIAAAARGRRLWIKGHGTGTLEAGRLETMALERSFPGSPIAGWKGSLGHTLGSCGLVELAVAAAAMHGGRTPGVVGSARPTFGSQVALDSFDNRSYDGVVCASNAFGGAHASLLVAHA